MKQFVLLFLIFPSLSFALEHMLIDKKNKDEKKVVWPLPKEVCAKIAVIKTMKNAVMVQREKSVPWRTNFEETQVYSKTWLPTKMTQNNLFENQLWFNEKDKAFEFRFDNDDIDDRNVFIVDRIGAEYLIGYDGPNNDGDEGKKIEGCRNGVILVTYSYKLPTERYHTVFHLFKQHGLSTKEYKGVQEKIETPEFEYECVLNYKGFPYTSESLQGHRAILCALASAKRGAFATVDETQNHHLYVFEYTYEKNDTDTSKPDQSFTTKTIATAEKLPYFKRLAWLYGKTLIALSDQHELYVLAVDEKNSRITCHKQKTDRKFKDFALARPYSEHEMVLVDEVDRLYYVNLKAHDSHNYKGFLYKKIVSNLEKNVQKKPKTTCKGTGIPYGEIDRVWIYGDLVGLKQRNVLPIHLMHLSEPWNANFFSLKQALVGVEDVRTEILQLVSPSQKEVKKTVGKKRGKK